MAKANSKVNAYLRTVIAPLVFPDGFKEINGELHGTCPCCGASEKHCGILIIEGIIAGHCVKCESTMKDFRAKNPELDEQVKGYQNWAKENIRSEEPVFVREHIYNNAFGRQLYKKQIYRLPNGKKTGRWMAHSQDGDGWDYNIPHGKHAPLYRVDELGTSKIETPESWVGLCEGEKDADSLVSLSMRPATCLPNGAVNAKTKIHPDWVEPFKGRKVVLFGDNDDPGMESVSALKKLLLPIVDQLKVIMPADLLDKPANEVAEHYDVTDYIDEVGKNAAYLRIKSLIDSLPLVVQDDEQVEDQLPAWIIESTDRGRTVRKINEPAFCDEFRNKVSIVKINGVFHIDGVAVTDDYVQSLVQDEVQKYFVEKTGKRVKDLMITLSNSCFAQQPEPDESKIYCKNNVTLTVSCDGTISAEEESVFTLTRIGADYQPDAECPTFRKYVADLFYDEDIPAVQEYIGYCLIPCTRAQAGAYLRGNGGEGKSTLRDVLMQMFGQAAIQESVHNLGDRFIMANFENRLVMIDDDLKTELLSDTSWIKKLTTAKQKFQVERKMKTKYDAFLYTRILGIGNSFIGSKFDHSDGFYRRQLLIDVRPKTRSSKDDDPFMSDKCIEELSGILNWALEGLSRLIRNNYHFSISKRMEKTLDDIKHDGDNVLTFLEDDSFLTKTDDWHTEPVTSVDLFTLYVLFCWDNDDTPVHRRTFHQRLSDRLKGQKIRVMIDGSNRQGYRGIQLTGYSKNRLKYLIDKDRERIARLP